VNKIKKKRKNVFMNVINPKTNTFRERYYKLKIPRLTVTNPAE